MMTERAQWLSHVVLVSTVSNCMYCGHSKHKTLTNVETMLGHLSRGWPNIVVVNKCVCNIACPPRAGVLRIGRATHECGIFPTTVLQDHFNMSSALYVIY